MILLICDWYLVKDKTGSPTGQKELLVNFAIDTTTDQHIPMPNQHPKDLGGHFNEDLQEWTL